MSPVRKPLPAQVEVRCRSVEDPRRLRRLAELLADVLDNARQSGGGSKQ